MGHVQSECPVLSVSGTIVHKITLWLGIKYHNGTSPDLPRIGPCWMHTIVIRTQIQFENNQKKEQAIHACA